MTEHEGAEAEKAGYEGGAFSPQIEGGKASGTIDLPSSRLRFSCPAQHVELPLEGLIGRPVYVSLSENDDLSGQDIDHLAPTNHIFGTFTDVDSQTMPVAPGHGVTTSGTFEVYVGFIIHG